MAGHEVPEHLVEQILKGRCIAFVGAGFSAPVVPSWRALLERLGERLGHPVTLGPGATALDFEAAGQLLRDHAGTEERWEREVKEVLERHEVGDAERERVRARCEWLQSIPFKAILTTNFDAWLTGAATDPALYWRILREDEGRWWSLSAEQAREKPRIPIIKLHGDANGNPRVAPIVLGRADYRRRVYSEQSYTTFIRAAFAEYTVLFLGVSFTDAYLNELRSETHLLLHGRGQAKHPWGYAVFTDKSADVVTFFRKHESIHGLVADSHDGFDPWLEAIAARTSLRGRLQQLVGNKTIVWVDANRDENQRGIELFRGCGADLQLLDTEAELEDRHASAALIVTRFGFEKAGDSLAFRALARVNTWSDRPPVIVFASPHAPVAENRIACLRRGAWEYATQWSELFRLIEILFGRVQ